jgi:hypothetical protein
MATRAKNLWEAETVHSTSIRRKRQQLFVHQIAEFRRHIHEVRKRGMLVGLLEDGDVQRLQCDAFRIRVLEVTVHDESLELLGGAEVVVDDVSTMVVEAAD